MGLESVFTTVATIVVPRGEPVMTKAKVILCSSQLAHCSCYQKFRDGMDDRSQPVSSGVYFSQLKGEGFSETRKVLFLK